MTQLQRIYKTAAYLSMDNLKKNVAAMVAVRVYVADKKDFEEKKSELNVSKPFSFTVIEEMKKEIPELETILQWKWSTPKSTYLSTLYMLLH